MHDKSPELRESMIVAHRGASREAPENTLPAFRLAWQQGADAIEADVHLTKDGHVVCIHDPGTKRVSDRDLVIIESTLDDLRKLDVGLSSGERFTGTRIPTLAEVLPTIPEKRKIYIEIKCGPEILPPLLNDVEHSGLGEEQIVFISFQARVIEQLKRRNPRHKAFWLVDFKKDEREETSPSLESVLQTLAEIHADGLDSNIRIPESYIQAIMRQGYEWHVWTVDDPEVAKRMRALGAGSITTNRPGLLKNGI